MANWQEGATRGEAPEFKGEGEENLLGHPVAACGRTVRQALRAGGAQLAWLRSALDLEP